MRNKWIKFCSKFSNSFIRARKISCNSWDLDLGNGCGGIVSSEYLKSIVIETEKI